MCPFCLATALWIAAGVGATGTTAALAVTSLRNHKLREHAQGANDDHQ
jgi:hypothetical protein